MIAFLTKLNVWGWLLAILAAAVAVGFAVSAVRYLLKRVCLFAALTRDSRRGRVILRPRHPWWWLVGSRCAYDLLIHLKDPETGQVAHTLAVKLIPTLARGREYSVGDLDRWETKLNFLMPMPYGVIKLDFGYRKCLPRPVERVFRNAPPDAVKVYLFHPHPHALTLARRGWGKGRSYGKAAEQPPIFQHEGVLILDLAHLRELETAEPEVRSEFLGHK